MRNVESDDGEIEGRLYRSIFADRAGIVDRRVADIDASVSSEPAFS